MRFTVIFEKLSVNLPMGGWGVDGVTETVQVV
jgi:hypothetical protein